MEDIGFPPGFLRSIQNLLIEHEDLCDVTFLVGSDTKKRIAANSTILALSSPYFKALLFGPWSSQGQEKIIEHMKPEIFENILNFIHRRTLTTSHPWLDNLEKAWEVRDAAQLFLLMDLVRLCDDFLTVFLTPEHVGRMLHLSQVYQADDMKERVIQTFLTWPLACMSSPSIQGLDTNAFLELLNMLSGHTSELTIQAVLNWGQRLSSSELSKFVMEEINHRMDWHLVSDASMTAIRTRGIFSMQMEHELMSTIIAYRARLPQPRRWTRSKMTFQVEGDVQSLGDHFRIALEGGFPFTHCHLVNSASNVLSFGDDLSLASQCQRSFGSLECITCPPWYSYKVPMDKYLIRCATGDGEWVTLENANLVGCLRKDCSGSTPIMVFMASFPPVLGDGIPSILQEFVPNQVRLQLEIRFHPDIYHELLEGSYPVSKASGSDFACIETKYILERDVTATVREFQFHINDVICDPENGGTANLFLPKFSCLF